MCHRRDALLLQKGGLAHQRACCQKENPALPPPLQPGQEMPAEHCCTAPRPRSAAVHRLALGIIEEGTAVYMILEEQALGGQQLPEQLTAHMAQVAGAWHRTPAAGCWYQ